jgi:hypothetical protein
MKTITNIIHPAIAVFAFACFALSPQARAVCHQGCDIAKQNTFFGDAALVGNTTGLANTAIGREALTANTSGFYNTAVGANALSANRIGAGNTAVGTNALPRNTRGSNNTATGNTALAANTTGESNTASGAGALYDNTSGSNNTATGFEALSYGNGSNNTAAGFEALQYNTTGNNNTAMGKQAMYGNVSVSSTGSNNTAIGDQALYSYTTGSNNTADGYRALNKNRGGADNVATGYQALLANTSGITNTAVGAFALYNSETGSGNIAIGFGAGSGVSSGSNNIDIANNGANESSTIRIGSANQTNTYIAAIHGVTVAGGATVYVESDGHLGTMTSSARFKDEIKPMGNVSEAILALKPVTFRYKTDAKNTPCFGLIAEEVEKVNSDLVVRDSAGRPYTVRYDQVNAMLLNEFLKEHKKVEEQQATIAELKGNALRQETISARQQKQIEALTAGLQKVSAQLATASPSRGGLEVSKSAPQTVLNN